MQRISKVELRHLYYFVAVAEELHFGRAARRLGMAQPPLSQQIRKLEEEMGAQLFQRNKRHVQLTEVGEVLLREARQTLIQAEQAIEATQKASRGEIGRLAIGFVGSATGEILPRLIRRFRERFPEVELLLREMTTAQQVRALRDGRIHVGLLRPPVNDKTLRVEVLHKEPLIAALPTDHPLATHEPFSLRDLEHESFIMFPRQLGAGLYDQVISLCQSAGFSPQVAQEAVQMQTILGLVAAGLGVSLVPASASYLRSAGVVYQDLSPTTKYINMAMAWHDAPIPTLLAFLQVARSCVEGP